MALSNEIASQFAKTVANKDKSRSENAVYGTVVVRNGESMCEWMVQIYLPLAVPRSMR